MTQDTLFPGLGGRTASGPVGRPTTGANGASHATHDTNAEKATAASLRGVACPVDCTDVPDGLRVFADLAPGRDAWLAWTADTSPAAAALAYRQRLGAWPAAVIRNPKGGHTLAGPLPAEVHR